MLFAALPPPPATVPAFHFEFAPSHTIALPSSAASSAMSSESAVNPKSFEPAARSSTFVCVTFPVTRTKSEAPSPWSIFELFANGTASIVWSGVNVATGTATFYRHVGAADDGTLSTTQPRIQGTVGTVGAELNLSSTSLTTGATQTIDYYSIALPTL